MTADLQNDTEVYSISGVHYSGNWCAYYQVYRAARVGSAEQIITDRCFCETASEARQWLAARILEDAK